MHMVLQWCVFFIIFIRFFIFVFENNFYSRYMLQSLSSRVIIGRILDLFDTFRGEKKNSPYLLSMRKNQKNTKKGIFVQIVKLFRKILVLLFCCS